VSDLRDRYFDIVSGRNKKYSDYTQPVYEAVPAR
jgi:hypothetical protein